MNSIAFRNKVYNRASVFAKAGAWFASELVIIINLVNHGDDITPTQRIRLNVHKHQCKNYWQEDNQCEIAHEPIL